MPPAAAARLLVAVDFSDATPDLVDVAARLAHTLGAGAALTLLHVLDLPERVRAERLRVGGAGPQGLVPMEDLARQQAELELRGLAARASLQGLEVGLCVEVGEVGDAVLEVARRTRPALLVLATHGRTGAARMLLGSVAQHVVARAPCPVLTYRLDVLRERARAAGGRA